MLFSFGLLGLFSALGAVAPSEAAPAPQQLPTVKFSTGTYRATSYDKSTDIYTFRNIRFGQPPVGDLRFRAPVKPEYNDTISDGSYGPQCYQILPTGSFSQVPGGSEDCLFLDLYVPAKQLQSGATKVPVVNWIYGGAFLVGSKDTYLGGPWIESAKGNLIYVGGNYRMGAFGFSTGSEVERDGTPNAAFYDQRAVLQWIQDEIHVVNGDPTDVTAAGESAGAGSIEFHLTAFGGKQDPLFHRAIVQSTAFQPLYDRQGVLTTTFENFTAQAGCAEKGIACMRQVSGAVLQNAQVPIIKNAPVGTFGFGPSADGKWVRQLPVLELASGNYWKSIDGLILSHVKDEARIFIGGIKSDDQLDNELPRLYPGSPAITAAIKARYPRSGPGSIFTTITERADAYETDNVFRCSIRNLDDAYKGKTWNIQYSRAGGLHAEDLFPDDWTNTPFAKTFRSYLTSFATTGDPNTLALKTSSPPAINWPKTSGDSGQMLGNVLNATNTGFEIIQDQEITTERCSFWVNVVAAATSVGGYVAPGGFVTNNILNITDVASASRNYATPPSSKFVSE